MKVFHNFSILIVSLHLFLIIFGLIVVSDSTITLLTAALGAAVGMSGGLLDYNAHELIPKK